MYVPDLRWPEALTDEMIAALSVANPELRIGPRLTPSSTTIQKPSRSTRRSTASSWTCAESSNSPTNSAPRASLLVFGAGDHDVAGARP